MQICCHVQSALSDLSGNRSEALGLLSGLILPCSPSSLPGFFAALCCPVLCFFLGTKKDVVPKKYCSSSHEPLLQPQFLLLCCSQQCWVTPSSSCVFLARLTPWPCSCACLRHTHTNLPSPGISTCAAAVGCWAGWGPPRSLQEANNNFIRTHFFLYTVLTQVDLIGHSINTPPPLAN